MPGWTLAPIQITATDKLRQPSQNSPIVAYTDATALPSPFDGESVIGVHDVCEGGLNLTKTAAATVAIACRRCGLRVTASSSALVTYGDLRARLP